MCSAKPNKKPPEKLKAVVFGGEIIIFLFVMNSALKTLYRHINFIFD